MRDEFGVNTEDLRPNEIAGYQALVDAARNNVLTTDRIRGSIILMKAEVEAELSNIEGTPQSWLSLLGLFLPIIGIIRKWYLDQHAMYLQARLKNLNLISLIFTNSERVQLELDKQINNLHKAQQEEEDRR